VCDRGLKPGPVSDSPIRITGPNTCFLGATLCHTNQMLRPAMRGKRGRVLATLLLAIEWKRKSAGLGPGFRKVADPGLAVRLLLRAPADPERQSSLCPPGLVRRFLVRGSSRVRRRLPPIALSPVGLTPEEIGDSGYRPSGTLGGRCCSQPCSVWRSAESACGSSPTGFVVWRPADVATWMGDGVSRARRATGLRRSIAR
jgi:hypothetical protein